MFLFSIVKVGIANIPILKSLMRENIIPLSGFLLGLFIWASLSIQEGILKTYVATKIHIDIVYVKQNEFIREHSHGVHGPSLCKMTMKQRGMVLNEPRA
jgi:hypothetical protein